MSERKGTVLFAVCVAIIIAIAAHYGNVSMSKTNTEAYRWRMSWADRK